LDYLCWIGKMFKYTFYIIFFLIKIVSTSDLNNNKFYSYENITNYEKKENYIYIYDNSKVHSKDDVLTFHDEFYISYYCKNDICVEIDNEYFNPFIEIPDKSGNVSLYIMKTFINHNSEIDSIPCNEVCVSYKCTNVSQCLYDKCVNNLCVFNENASVIHCDDIYTKPGIFKKRSSYMYCGKAYNDKCTNDNECSSKVCNKDGFCLKQTKGPSDSEGTANIVIIYYDTLIFLFFLFLLLFICCLCFCCNDNNDKKDTL